MSDKFTKFLKIQYFTELLKLAKETYSWVEISKRTGISPSALSRYLHGRVFPVESKVSRLIEIIEDLANIDDIIKSRLVFDRNGFLNNQKLISDISLLKILAMKYSAKYRGSVDAILSPAADGIPYATLLAEYSGVPLIIAKNTKEVGVNRFVEGSVMTEDGRLLPYYFARFLIRKNYRVLIVDDVIRTGRTHQCLIDMVKKIKAYPIAIHVIIAIGSGWRNRIREVPVEPITIVS